MPNFCKNSNVLLLIVFVTLIAFLLELFESAVLSMSGLALKVTYLLWVTLICAGFLCWVSRYFNLNQKVVVSPLQWSLLTLACLSLFVLMELLIQYYFYRSINVNRFLRFLVIATVVLFIVFRVFALFDVFRIRAQAETFSRMQALQARIEPHFLFNSLNTIAELTHLDPQQAEEAIQSLSSLIRNSLSDESVTHSLKDEIQLCRQYLQLEKWRLGDRLEVSWDVQVDEPEKNIIPKVLIQPLIENAVIHGVAPFEEGGKVSIIMLKKKRMMQVVVENESHGADPESQQENKDGLGIALNNIKERLFVLYDDNHKFHVKHSKGQFIVSLELPDRLTT